MSKLPGIVVVKMGGEILLNAGALDGLAAEIAGLALEGVEIVVAHGGGPQADALAEKLGYVVRKVGGRRITDAGALEVAKMVYRGSANVELVAAIGKHGARAVGLSGVDAALIRAARRPPVANKDGVTGVETLVDFGAVGDITAVNTSLLTLLLSKGYVPVLASLCADEQGNIYNVNADTVAQAVAVALGAGRLIMLTNVAGILRNQEDPLTRIPACNLAEVQALIADGTIAGGMLPKVQNCIEAISAGIPAVQIVDGTARPSLLRDATEGKSVGTVITGV
ncbi:MAG: acetylglutamate kinase [Chloroflexota bacterium]